MCERASYARTIAYIIEHVRLVHAPAPEPHHVLVPITQERQPRAVVVRPQRRQEVVRRDPVRACNGIQLPLRAKQESERGRRGRTTHEHPHAVDLEEERRAFAVLVCLFERFLNKLHPPEADALRERVEDSVALY